MAEVEFVIVADHAEAVNGKVYVMGGGLSHIFRAVAMPQGGMPPQPPALTHFAIAVSVLVDWNEANEPMSFSVGLEDDDAQVLFEMKGELKTGRPAAATRGAPLRNAIALPIILGFPKAGGYRVRAQVITHPAVSERTATFEVIDQFLAPAQMA